MFTSFSITLYSNIPKWEQLIGTSERMSVGESIDIPNLSKYSLLIVSTIIDGNTVTTFSKNNDSYCVISSHWTKNGFIGCWKFTYILTNNKLSLIEGYNYISNKSIDLAGTGVTYFRVLYVYGLV